jgi:hypothetical protein
MLEAIYNIDIISLKKIQVIDVLVNRYKDPLKGLIFL